MDKAAAWTRQKHGQGRSMDKAAAWTRQKHGQGRSMDKEETWSRDMVEAGASSKQQRGAEAWRRSMEKMYDTSICMEQKHVEEHRASRSME
jgi:hypothetical protein